MNRLIGELKGIGQAKIKILNGMNIFTIEDLLYRFPRKYLDRNLISSISGTETEKTITLVVQIDDKILTKKGLLIVNCSLDSKGKKKRKEISLLWFRSGRYLVGQFKKNQELIVTGKLEYRKGYQMVHPEFEILDDDDKNSSIHAGRIIPVYASGKDLKNKNLDSRGMRKIISELIKSKDLNIPELIPEKIRKI